MSWFLCIVYSRNPISYFLLACGHSVFSNNNSSIDYLFPTVIFVNHQLTVYLWVYFWDLYYFPLVYISIFMLAPFCFNYCNLVILKSGLAMPPALFFHKITLAIMYLLWFYINFRIFFYFCKISNFYNLLAKNSNNPNL